MANDSQKDKDQTDRKDQNQDNTQNPDHKSPDEAKENPNQGAR